MGSNDFSYNIKSFVNFKAIAIILSLSISFQIYLYLYEDETTVFEINDIIVILPQLAVGIMSLAVAKSYWGSSVFGKSYFVLGLGFIFYFLGDVVWEYYEIFLDVYPYPSIADVFYLAFSPLAMYHLIINTKYFTKKISTLPVIALSGLTITIVSLYSYFSLADIGEANFDFYFGLLYVSFAATILSLAILGLTVFRTSELGNVWLVLVIGIFIFTVADVWYYYLELFGEFTYVHPTNTLWVLSFLVIIYALYKHLKAI